MATGTGSQTASSGSLEITRDNFIPLFDNKTSSYKEWMEGSSASLWQEDDHPRKEQGGDDQLVDLFVRFGMAPKDGFP